MRAKWLVVLPGISAALASSANDTLLWGAYRPNLYFGLRPRIPQSLKTGLMWFGVQDYSSISKTRHSCEQNELDSYMWTEYDPREGGVQVLKDGLNNVKITTEFIKVPGGDHGGSWAARIRGEPLRPNEVSRVSLVYYAGLEGSGSIQITAEGTEDGLEGDVQLYGETPELGEFTMRIIDGPRNDYPTNAPFYEDFKKWVDKTHFVGTVVQPGNIWKAKDILVNAIANKFRTTVAPYEQPNLPHPGYALTLPNEVYSGSNLFAVQKTFDGAFHFDVLFDSGSAKQKLTTETLDKGIPALVEGYNQRFRKTLPQPADYPSDKQQSLETFSKAVTSNLIGGVGYFYGNSMVDQKFSYEWDEDEDAEEQPGGTGARFTEPKSLLTATPSRSFFPRGFYWDEGFHLLHIGQWDNDFSLEILKDWINLIDENGWVAREQILGEEARSKVPAEFQTQVPNYANPPTLAMAVTAFIDRFKAVNGHNADGPSDTDLGMDTMGDAAQVPLGVRQTVDSHMSNRHLQDRELAFSYLESIYEPLKRHYEWFRRTQRGQIKQYARKARSRTEGYRWRGRSEVHVLTSGMDDYPRGPPHAGELHLDLISWMAFFSRTMKDISGFIGEKDDEANFAKIEKAILDNIEDLHWNEEEQMYCDVGVNDDDESYHICHKGYLSLFPFLLSLLPPDSPHLGSILDLVRDEQHLWSPYGLRSLSASHPEFGKGENYWKGPIWIQMNYLALSALHKTYASQPGPYQEKAKEIYKELRTNVVDNVVKEYERTGYVWEQYNPLTGQGQRSHPFTGWTSLTALILAEKY